MLTLSHLGPGSKGHRYRVLSEHSLGLQNIFCGDVAVVLAKAALAMAMARALALAPEGA